MARQDDTQMKNPFSLLTENTGVSLSLLFLCGGVMAGVIAWGYNQTMAMNEIRYELKELRQMIQTQWTRQDHDIWAMQLALRNPNLTVPLNGEPRSRDMEYQLKKNP